ncbi:MAG: hypothetical protein B0D92_04640 [Spirochaeta sp. LUC14_002_19_P3]|nr:MAG: hypothetical protein B0D92_04640 [Spirochaeta sp. LUC14_002_19_P3]
MPSITISSKLAQKGRLLFQYHETFSIDSKKIASVSMTNIHTFSLYFLTVRTKKDKKHLFAYDSQEDCEKEHDRILELLEK